MVLTIIACICSFLFGFGFCKFYYKVPFLLMTTDLFVDIALGKLSEEELGKKIKVWKEEAKNLK